METFFLCVYVKLLKNAKGLSKLSALKLSKLRNTTAQNTVLLTAFVNICVFKV